MADRVLKIEKNPYSGYLDKIVVREIPHVLIAFKTSFAMKIWNRPTINSNTGWLISKNGKLTRNVDEALVFNLEEVLWIEENNGKVIDEHHSWAFDHHIQFYKDSLWIRVEPLSKAQKFLDSHPLPRKSIGKMVRLDVYNKYGGRCAYCGCELEIGEMQVDHFIAHMSHGGEDTLDNYYPACSICNRIKRDGTIDEFKQGIRHCGEIHRKRKKPIMADSDKIAIKYDLTKEDHEITFFYEKYESEPKIDVKKVEVQIKNEKED